MTLPLSAIQIKRGFLFFLGSLFFLLPSNNWYAVVQAVYQPTASQPIATEVPTVADYPVNFTGISLPFLTARSLIVIDRDSAVVVAAKDKKTKLLPASTVKLMTALIALDHYQLDDLLVVNEVNGQGQDMELKLGESMRVENLLYGVLVASANDAAILLATNYPGGLKSFVEAMNKKAEALHLEDTYFANPTGLDSDPQDNLLADYSYSTSLDLARLAREVMKEPVLREMVGTTRVTVTDTSGLIEHHLYNVNELLYWFPGMKGVKTGWTEEAGECLVSYVERDGRGVISVVLGSEDRFGETARLVDWFFSNYRWEEVTPSTLN